MKKRGVFFTQYLVVIGLFVSLSGCLQDKRVDNIQFTLVAGQQQLHCEKSIDIEDKHWNIEQFQFYISELSFQHKNGKWLSFPFVKNQFQTKDIALLGEHCLEKALANWEVKLSEALPIENIKTLAFTIGIPFAENHLNPLTQESPLNNSSMFWVWQTGHKFLRLEMSSEESFWLYHLGSTGCSAPSALRPPQSECRQPNQVRIELDISEKSTPNVLTLEFDLLALLHNVALNDSTQCQSEKSKVACQQLLKNISHLNESAVFKVSHAN